MKDQQICKPYATDMTAWSIEVNGVSATDLGCNILDFLHFSKH